MENCLSECLQLCVEIESEIDNENCFHVDDVGDLFKSIKSSGEEFVSATAVSLSTCQFSKAYVSSDTQYPQLGLVLMGKTVESIVPGGPAFHSQQISTGDSIIEIDGTATTDENIGDLILGGDEPGSPVSIMVRKSDSKVLRNRFVVLSSQLTVAI